MLTTSRLKNPTQQLENLRKTSLIEFEHLKMPSPTSRKLSNRDMPEHAVDPTHPAASSTSPPNPISPPDKGYFGLEEIPEEEGSAGLSNESAQDDLSPTSTLLSNATVTAELGGGATTGGKVMFQEPEFGLQDLDISSDKVRRSPGSFSAETAREDSQLSPTER